MEYGRSVICKYANSKKYRRKCGGSAFCEQGKRKTENVNRGYEILVNDN